MEPLRGVPPARAVVAQNPRAMPPENAPARPFNSGLFEHQLGARVASNLPEPLDRSRSIVGNEVDRVCKAKVGHVRTYQERIARRNPSARRVEQP